MYFFLRNTVNSYLFFCLFDEYFCSCCGLQEWLLRQVCASEAVEPVISNLVSVLLKGCQDSSPEARLLCGECLGELGAVDPGRLDLSRTHSNGDHNTLVVS